MSPYRTGRPFRRALRTAASAVAALTLLLGWFTATGSTAYAQQAAATATTASTALTGKAVEIRGGDILYSSSGTRCTVAFNARGGTTTYGLMTGRCARGATSWYADPALTVFVGTTEGGGFPGGDHALVRYTTGTAVTFPGEVTLGPGGGTVDITGAANPAVGQSVCHVSGGTGLRCGTVTALNIVIRYPDGTISQVFSANICSDSGAVGGPAFSGGTALGVLAAGNGNCSSGGTTYYLPVVEWLAKYGLSLY
ncbi:S1 family peptidase [Streptomyces sp. NBC_01506]|uniref:S1 family peptidase n=1 Tax=Streptomyces sp. NBC_01506 TaxID=2903887 RepID=UPI00386445A4